MHCAEVFGSIKDLEAGRYNGPIHISCKDIFQTHRPENQQVKCENTAGDGKGGVGGYAFAYGPEHEDGTIVLCKRYFEPGQQSLSEIYTEIQKAGPSTAKNPNNIIGKGKLLLHELTHLPSISKAQSGSCFTPSFSTL